MTDAEMVENADKCAEGTASKPPCDDCAQKDSLSLRLELMLAQKDAEIAALRAEVTVEKLRKLEGAAESAAFDFGTMQFQQEAV